MAVTTQSDCDEPNALSGQSKPDEEEDDSEHIEPITLVNPCTQLASQHASCGLSAAAALQAAAAACPEEATTTVAEAAAALAQPGPTTTSGGGASGAVTYFNWDNRVTCRNALDTLVSALTDDPINAYFCGKKRKRFVKEEVRGYLRALPRAAHFIATPDAHAVALWQLMPHETPHNELLAGWSRILRVPLRLWRQLLALELHYESAHARIAAAHGAYYYLSFIGTRPESRGRGAGSLLLRHITQRADSEGRCCLLEATSARSRNLYARHGFTSYEEYCVTKSAPPVFFMIRPPQPLGGPAEPADAAAVAAKPGMVAGMVPALGAAAAAVAAGVVVRGGGGAGDGAAAKDLVGALLLKDLGVLQLGQASGGGGSPRGGLIPAVRGAGDASAETPCDAAVLIGA